MFVRDFARLEFILKEWCCVWLCFSTLAG